MNNWVFAITDFNDGGGPALYAGGAFTGAGVSASRIARWDGSGWSALNSGTSGAVNVLAVFDDGTCSGPALVAGGSFRGAIDSHDSYVAKWDCAPQAATPGCFDAFCFGDGLDPNVTTICPCANFGSFGHGCANSTNPSGALLSAMGTAQPDTIVLLGSGMPA